MPLEDAAGGLAGLGSATMAEEILRDDATWDRLWERLLSPLERHDIAMDVLRRRLPTEAFERRIARELVRRWRRHALVLALGYSLWTLFWGALAWHLVGRGSRVAGLPLACAAVGALAVAACLVFRRWVSSIRA